MFSAWIPVRFQSACNLDEDIQGLSDPERETLGKLSHRHVTQVSQQQQSFPVLEEQKQMTALSLMY